MITSSQILEKKFSAYEVGYNREEVDQELESLADRIDNLNDARDSLRRKLLSEGVRLSTIRFQSSAEAYSGKVRHEYHFSSEEHGYCKEEVDAFLQNVLEEIDRLLHNNQLMREALAKARKPASTYSGSQRQPSRQQPRMQQPNIQQPIMQQPVPQPIGSCPNCGAGIFANENNCRNCGYPIGRVSPAPNMQYMAGQYNSAQYQPVQSQSMIGRQYSAGQYNAAQKKPIKGKIIAILASLVVIAVLLVINVVIPNVKYNHALELIDKGQYDEAISALQGMLDHSGAEMNISKAYYLKGSRLIDQGEYELAIQALNNAPKITNSATEIKRAYYLWAEKYKDSGDYKQAENYYSFAIGYSDVDEQVSNCKLQQAIEKYRTGNYTEAYEDFLQIQNEIDVTQYLNDPQIKAAASAYKETKLSEARTLCNQGQYGAAAKVYGEIPGYSYDEIKAMEYFADYYPYILSGSSYYVKGINSYSTAKSSATYIEKHYKNSSSHLVRQIYNVSEAVLYSSIEIYSDSDYQLIAQGKSFARNVDLSYTGPFDEEIINLACYISGETRPTATVAPSTAIPVANSNKRIPMANNQIEECAFGHYEQDNDATNGEEPIAWVILEENENEWVLMSKDIIEAQYFDKNAEDGLTWEMSALREWLNTVFYDRAFSEQEKKAIAFSYVPNPPNPIDGTYNGVDTNDYVYILSLPEVLEYFNVTYEEIENPFKLVFMPLVAYPTEYVKQHYSLWSYDFDEDSLRTKEEFRACTGSTRWYLRTINNWYKDNSNRYVCHVNEVGCIEESMDGRLNRYGIRPVIRIKKPYDLNSTVSMVTPLPTSTPSPKPTTAPTKKPTSSTPFTNKYGTPTTKCAHPGCNNYIASSGDTNCCTMHSKRCAECGKYIDEDAFYCMDCIKKALGK